MRKLIAPITAAADGILDAIFMLVWVSVFVTLVSVGASLAIFGVGFFILAGAVLASSWYFDVENRRAAEVYGVDLPVLSRRVTSAEGWRRPLAQAWLDVTSAAWWRSLLHHLLTGLLGWLTWSAVALAGIGIAELVSAFIPRTSDSHSWVWPPDLPPVQAAILGAICLGVSAGVLFADFAVHRSLTRGLLDVDDEQLLRQQLQQTTQQRDGAVRTVDSDRRRIERDLHDGVQPQLVTVGMMLSMAQSKLESDPEGAKALLAEAHAGTKTAIADLRRLGRGIHPAVLTDSGLDAAMSALAAQFTFPVSVETDLPTRCRSEVEGAAYFVVAEALSNAYKHSGATVCAVRARLTGEDQACQLLVDVVDNGHGGAVLLPNGGLSGLRDRVAALGGRLDVHSTPAGTTVAAVLPCG